MAKSLQFPINDVLQQFRIAALTTPPAAFEMSNLDREMGDILSRTDLPKDVKVKMYNETLDKFRDARHSFKNVSTVPSSIKAIHPESENTAAKLTDDAAAVDNDDANTVNSVAAPTTPLKQVHPQIKIAQTPQKPTVADLKQNYADIKNQLKEHVTDSIRSSTVENNGLVYDDN